MQGTFFRIPFQLFIHLLQYFHFYVSYDPDFFYGLENRLARTREYLFDPPLNLGPTTVWSCQWLIWDAAAPAEEEAAAADAPEVPAAGNNIIQIYFLRAGKPGPEGAAL